LQVSEYKHIDWHLAQWITLLGGGLERIAHANLLTGPAGVGKHQFAAQLVALLLCEQVVEPAGSAELPRACGTCPSCHWLDSDSHPDFRHVCADAESDAENEEAAPRATESKKKRASSVIKIDAIRALEDFVYVGSHRQGRRVVLISDADQMNGPAANALLKILEEPPASVYFILVTSRLRVLLPTIRSRCRLLAFRGPPRDQAEAWLRAHEADSRSGKFLDVAGGAPLQVLEWQKQGVLAALENALDALSRAREPLALAKDWDDLLKREPVLTLDMLVEAVQRWLLDATLIAAGLPVRYHSRWNLPERGKVATLPVATKGWRELLRFKRSARHPLNQQLFLEEFSVFALHALNAGSAGSTRAA
jgi:DNA polymerase-3 subunit delta'